ncbi:hypothetical protein NHX12_027471 [Muraenolepis orangiensis]|uniref:Solute carrier family 10 member 6 n=1 Tax=Muraenolepis orangiensis TaxID=630683 RepID=A0A9Q0INV6_9TELE|nr:hypothetical protein NHX12_027471 [Muraenolepis orangiensis]
MADYDDINATTTTGTPHLPGNTASPAGNGSLGGGLGGGGLGGGSLHAALGIFLAVMLGTVVFSLGCTVEVSKLWGHLRRPRGVLVGLGCQFGLMPLTAYLLSRGLGLGPLQAVAVVVMGCCPGGVISNVVTYWLDGDMDLSITMTTCSTMLSLGMMPLCLYGYTRVWVEAARINIPFSNMGVTLLSLVLPVAGGVAVNYKWPSAAKIILKVGSVAGGGAILVVGVASAFMYRGSWQTDTSLILIAAVFPLIGYSAGFVIAVVCRQPWQRCRTIAMETGAQNVQISATVLQLSFPPEQLAVMFTFPLMYGSFQLFHSLLLVSDLGGDLLLVEVRNCRGFPENIRTTPSTPDHLWAASSMLDAERPTRRSKVTLLAQIQSRKVVSNPGNGSSVSGGLLQGFCFLGMSVLCFGTAMVPLQRVDVGDGKLVFCSTMALEALLVFVIRGCPHIWALNFVSGMLYSIVTTFLFVGYCFLLKNRPHLPPNCVVPAFASGSMQFMAYCAFFESSYYLGTIVTYPIGSVVGFQRAHFP